MQLHADVPHAAVDFRLKPSWKFVESMIGLEMKDPIEGAYGGLVLGGRHFVKEALLRMEETTPENRDIARGRALRTAWKMEEIIEAITSRMSHVKI